MVYLTLFILRDVSIYSMWIYDDRFWPISAGL